MKKPKKKTDNSLKGNLPNYILESVLHYLSIAVIIGLAYIAVINMI
jgi:hypothetical protein